MSIQKCVNETHFRRTRSAILENVPDGEFNLSVMPITSAVVNRAYDGDGPVKYAVLKIELPSFSPKVNFEITKT